MNPPRLPLTQSVIVRGLFAAALITIPFDAIRGVAALGELGNELSLPFFLAAIGGALVVGIHAGGTVISRSIALRIGAAILAVILLSYLVNVASIHNMVVRERGGFNKFATSLMVLLYGLGIAWLAEHVEGDQWRTLVARSICLSALVAILYVPFEVLGRTGALGGLFNAIDSIIHSRQADAINAWNNAINQKVLYGWDDRIRSVSFEPPAFGNYTGFAWPWVWYAALKADRGRRLRYWALLTVFTLVILWSGSRTGTLMLGLNLIGIGLLAFVYGKAGSNNEALAAARLLVPVAALLCAIVAAVVVASNYGSLVDRMITGDSVSNVSRSAFIVAGLDIFRAHPLFGVGLGQFGLYAASALPDWAYRSYEVGPMITFPAAPWPTAYSIYARLAAELGLVGLVGWIGLWLGLAILLVRRARRERGETGERITPVYPVVLNCLAVLMSGIASDTFRTPMIWIALGLACALLRRPSGAFSRPQSRVTG